VTIVEFSMDPLAVIDQELPASYNGFLFIVRGSVRVGDHDVKEGQVGCTAGDEGARVVLYAGEPTNAPIVSHGPFIGDTREDIARLYAEYRAGTFARMSELSRA
jgi:redox-sensitive bicupin YhaK (pirin superfamily)